MYDWNHDGKIDLRDGFIQDEIESRNTGIGAGNGSTGGGSGGGSTGGGSGGSCIVILLIPVILLFLYAVVNSAPSGVFSIIFFLFALAVILGWMMS